MVRNRGTWEPGHDIQFLHTFLKYHGHWYISLLLTTCTLFLTSDLVDVLGCFARYFQSTPQQDFESLVHRETQALRDLITTVQADFAEQVTLCYREPTISAFILHHVCWSGLPSVSLSLHTKLAAGLESSY